MTHPSEPPPLPLWRGTPRAVAPPLGAPPPLLAARPAPGIRQAAATTTAPPRRPPVPGPSAAPVRPPAWAPAPTRPAPPHWNPPQLGPRRRRPLPVLGALACVLLASLAWYLRPGGSAPAAAPPVTVTAPPSAAPPSAAPSSSTSSSAAPDRTADRTAPALLGLTELRHLLDRTLTEDFDSAVPLPPAGSGPCELARQPATEALFANGWTAFRSAGYRNAGALTVDQSVAVYPDAATAEALLRQLGDAVRTCRSDVPDRTGPLSWALATDGLTWATLDQDDRLPCYHQAERTGGIVLLVDLCGPGAEADTAAALVRQLGSRLSG